MKFKVGDKVRVRHGLKHGDSYDDIYCNEIMSKMGGEILTIKNVRSYYYDIKENGWYWNDDMLEPVSENTKEDKIMSKFKVGDKVKVREDLKRRVDYYDGTKEFHDVANEQMVLMAGRVVTITEVGPYYYGIKECEGYWYYDMFDTSTTINAKENKNMNMRKVCYEIVDYKYDAETGETYIRWADKTETTVKPEEGTKPNQYVGFVTAYAKRAAGNTSRINSLFDYWTIKKPIRDKKAKEADEAAKTERKRITEKRKAKKEKWLLRREVLRRKRAYEAAQIAQKEYGVPVDFNEETK